MINEEKFITETSTFHIGFSFLKIAANVSVWQLVQFANTETKMFIQQVCEFDVESVSRFLDSSTLLSIHPCIHASIYPSIRLMPRFRWQSKSNWIELVDPSHSKLVNKFRLALLTIILKRKCTASIISWWEYQTMIFLMIVLHFKSNVNSNTALIPVDLIRLGWGTFHI